MSNVYYYNIAEYDIRIHFSNTRYHPQYILSSFEPFRQEKPKGKLFFDFTIDNHLCPYPKEKVTPIRTFDTGNGNTTVDLLDNGGYQYIIKDIEGNKCALLISNKDFSECHCALRGTFAMQRFGINNALMLVFAFAGNFHQTLLLHASLVRKDGYGYAFIAKSGVGKSTHVSLWLRNIEGCDLMNDDNPILRIINGKPFIYGSPWSGKTPCYRNIKAKLGAITRIDRASQNSIEQVRPAEAFASLLPACSTMKWDQVIFHHTCNTIAHIIETTSIYTLHCLPNEEAAIICQKIISKN